MTVRFRPGAVDYERQAPHYSGARGLTPASEKTWQEAVTRHVSPLIPQLVLDLGSGTGRFSPLLAEWLAANVVGVEPSRQMRSEAVRAAAHPNVTYLGGDAQHIPLADATCDAAWLGYMVHHVPDHLACARELTRVLRPGGLVLVAGAYTEARRNISLLRYFPSALRVIDTFPTAEEIAAQFAAGGLDHLTTETVQVESVASLNDAARRTAQRADTILSLISDEDFAAGQRAIEAAAAAETEPRPISDGIDLLVFRRR